MIIEMLITVTITMTILWVIIIIGERRDARLHKHD
jgi:hypothetical protein